MTLGNNMGIENDKSLGLHCVHHVEKGMYVGGGRRKRWGVDQKPRQQQCHVCLYIILTRVVNHAVCAVLGEYS